MAGITSQQSEQVIHPAFDHDTAGGEVFDVTGMRIFNLHIIRDDWFSGQPKISGKSDLADFLIEMLQFKNYWCNQKDCTGNWQKAQNQKNSALFLQSWSFL
ncbi:MAG: hypothetical protein OS112_08460 [Methanoregula sp.]|nr:MAG: hypothetical protein OS112_08460 [Methanoregula sp.]